MGYSVIVYTVLCCLFVQVVKADDTSGICYVRKSKLKEIKQVYYVMRDHTTRTCWGLNWKYGINCKEKTVKKPKHEIRFINITVYERVKTCCVGFTKNGTICQKGCEAGTYGESCDKSCNCSNIPNSAGHCNRTTGECICDRGWLGENCSESCPTGYFGQNCESLCPCRNNATCNTTDGSCNCTVPGWTGEYCDQECAEGFFGINCLEICSCNNNQTCDPYTGSCVCIPGRTGQNCTEVCRNNTFGPDCKHDCHCHLNGTRYCNPENGTCECLPGRSGPYCYRYCTHGRYGEGCQALCNCSTENEYCNPVNGQCMSICRNNTFGPDCKHDCHCHLNGTRYCDPENGTCECLPGRSGPYCYRYCTHGRYGEGCQALCNCSTENEYCNPVNGQCMSKCFCNREGTTNCEDKNCTCPNKVLDEKQCNQTHSSHYQRYKLADANILDLCACRFDGDQLCVPTNNSCVCKPGYNGQNCRSGKRAAVSNPKGQSNGDDKGSNVYDKGTQSVIIGVIIAAVVIFVLVLVVTGIFCRIRRKKMTQSVNNPMYNLPDKHNNGIKCETETNLQHSQNNLYSQATNLEADTEGTNGIIHDKPNDNEKETSFLNNTDEELYNKANRDEHQSDDDDETQNFYSHTQIGKQDGVNIDETYDIMEHNKHKDTQDDTYDYTLNMDSEYDIVNNKE